MPSVETLREIKRAEEEASRLKAKAKEDAERMLRDATREAELIKQQAAEEAQRAYDAGIQAARVEVEREKRGLHQQGEQDAKAIAAKASSPALSQAVDALLRKFDQRVRG